jgi:membrane peptidoglycan carboxypeptidase
MARSTTWARQEVVAAALALCLGAVVVVVAAAWFASPTPSAIKARVQARLGHTGGRVVSLAAVPLLLRDAVVATEDERFYHHHGIDIIGVLRALPYDLTHLSFAEGASTITEQVVKVLYLGGNDHSLWRKLEDAATAVKLEQRASKAQILSAYLNSAYFGEGAYGIASASERYFGVRPSELGLDRASLLAGLIQAPSAYDPFVRPGLARARQAEVLRSMVRDGMVGLTVAQDALAQPLRLRGGTVLPGVRGVDLASGPAFVWWQLALGTAIIVAGAAAVPMLRLAGLRRMPIVPVLRLVTLLAGIVLVVRAFRVA